MDIERVFNKLQMKIVLSAFKNKGYLVHSFDEDSHEVIARKNDKADLYLYTYKDNKITKRGIYFDETDIKFSELMQSI